MKKRRILLGLGAISCLSLATVLASCDGLDQKFKVTFYDGTEQVATQDVVYGFNVTVPANPQRDGDEKFNGWFADEALTTPFDFGSIIEKDTSVYAKWISKFAVDFVDGTTTLSTSYVETGYNVNIPTAPTKANKKFNGWYSNAECTKKFDFGTVITAPTKVYAGWIDQYTVTFKNGDTTLSTQTLNKKANVEVPTAPTAENKIFNGWYSNAECTTPFDFGTEVTSSTTIYAGWVNEYAVVFKNGDTVVSTKSVKTGYNVEPIADLEETGKIFNGWYKDADCTIPFNFGTVITEATTIYAGWVKQYAVTFKNGDSIVSTKTVNAGYNVAPIADLEETGKRFNGWYKDQACTEEFDFGSVITEATTIYAGWVDKYTVSFMNGDTLVSEESVYDGELVEVPTNVPSKTGYYFNGWFVDKEFKEAFDFGNPITEATSVYAKFAKIDFDYISNHANNVFETNMDYEKVSLDEYRPGEENVYNINQKDGLTIEIKDGKLVGTDASETESAQAIVDFGGMSVGVLEGVLKYTPVNTSDSLNSGWSVVQWQGANNLDQFNPEVLFALRTNGDKKIQFYFESECGIGSDNKKTYKFYGNAFTYTPNQEYEIYWKYDFYENKITIMIDDSIIVEDLDVPSEQPFVLNNLLFITAGSDTKRGFNVDDVALMVDEGELEAIKTYYINLLDKLYSKLDLENDYKLYGDLITKEYNEAKEKIAEATDSYEAQEAAFDNELMNSKSDKVIREYVVTRLEEIRTVLLNIITLYADDLNELTDEAIANVQKATTQEEFENSYTEYFKQASKIKTDATVRYEKATTLADYYYEIVENIDSEMDGTKKDKYVAELDLVMGKYLGEDEDDFGIFGSCDITEIEANFTAAKAELDAIVTKYTSAISEYIETLEASYIEYVDAKDMDPEFKTALKAVELDFTNALTNEAADQVLTDAKSLVDAVVGLDDYLGDGVDTLLIAAANMTEFKASYYDDFVTDFVADVKNFISGTETEANIKANVDSFIATVKSETECAVKFYDGTTEMATLAKSVLKDSKVIKPTDPTKEGYEFAGWYNSNQLTTAFDFDNTTISTNTNIYAKWYKKVVATIDFKSFETVGTVNVKSNFKDAVDFVTTDTEQNEVVFSTGEASNKGYVINPSKGLRIKNVDSNEYISFTLTGQSSVVIDFNQANDGERGFDLYNGTTKYLSVIAAKKSVTGYETEGDVNFDATTDVMGTEYKRAKNSSIKVNLSNLPAGTYYIKVANGHGGDMFFNTITITTLK